MNTPAHTPTPWKTDATNDKVIGIWDDETKTLIQIARCTSPRHAAFIVRACNSHAALVAALERFLKAQDENDRASLAAAAILASAALEELLGVEYRHGSPAERARQFEAAQIQGRAALTAAKE